jgi:UDP-glucose 4-epimerase
MNILILGSCGFIGSHLSAHFMSDGHALTGCDLVENAGAGYAYRKVSVLSSDFDTLFSNNAFDICINASGSGNVSYSIMQPLSDFEANTMAVAKVLDTIRKIRPACKYLHISSAAVYGNPVSLPVTEEMAFHPLSPYGWHKLMSEMICREYHEVYGLPVAILRPFSVYGNGLRKQLLWDVCTKLQDQERVTLFGTGKESRDFIHIEDLCSLIDHVIAKSDFNADVYNAGNGVQVQVGTIAGLLQQYFISGKSIAFSGEGRKGDPLFWEADISKVAKLGYRPKISLEAGVKEYVSYFKEWITRTD